MFQQQPLNTGFSPQSTTQLPSLADHANNLLNTALSLPPDHPMVQPLMNMGMQMGQAASQSLTPPDGYTVAAADGHVYQFKTPELASQFKEQYGAGTQHPFNPNYQGAGGSQAVDTTQPAKGLSWGQDVNNFVQGLPQASETTVANATQIPQLAVTGTDLAAAFGSPNDQARTQKMNQPRDLSKLGLGEVSPDSSILGGLQQGFGVGGTVMGAGDLADTVSGGISDATDAIKGLFSGGKVVASDVTGEAGAQAFTKVYNATTGAKSAISKVLGDGLTALDTSAPNEVATLSKDTVDAIKEVLPDAFPKQQAFFRGQEISMPGDTGEVSLNHTDASKLLSDLNDAGKGNPEIQALTKSVKSTILNAFGGEEGAFAQLRSDYGESANTIRGLGKISDLTPRSTVAARQSATNEIVKMFESPINEAQTRAAISDFAKLSEKLGNPIDLTDEYEAIKNGTQVPEAKASILQKIGKWAKANPIKATIGGYFVDKIFQKLGLPNIPL